MVSVNDLAYAEATTSNFKKGRYSVVSECEKQMEGKETYGADWKGDLTKSLRSLSRLSETSKPKIKDPVITNYNWTASDGQTMVQTKATATKHGSKWTVTGEVGSGSMSPDLWGPCVSTVDDGLKHLEGDVRKAQKGIKYDESVKLDDSSVLRLEGQC
ncbi:hypothetical protein P7C73_g727, partial [Tremellales sp. Uapishka_1]